MKNITYDPNSERRARFARREQSAIPLSPIEQAERRHYLVRDYWRYVFLFTPSVVGLLPGLLFNLLPVSVVAAIGFWIAFAVGGLIAWSLRAHFASSPALWIRTQAWCHAGVGAGWAFVIITSDAFAAGGISGGPFFAVIIGAAIAAWPWVYAWLRANNPTDYERYLAEAQAPQQGLME